MDGRLLFSSTVDHKPSFTSGLLFTKRDPEVSHTESDWLHHTSFGNTGLSRDPNRERYSKPKHVGERATPYNQEKDVNTLRIKKTVCYEIDKDKDLFDLIKRVFDLIEDEELLEEKELKKETDKV